MKGKHYFMLAMVALATMLFAFDAAAASHVWSALTADPTGFLVAPIAAAALPEAISAELEKISGQIKAQADAAEKELKRTSQLSEETRASVNQMLTTQGELQARLQAAEQAVATMDRGNGDIAAQQSMGEQFVSSEAFQAWAKRPSGNFGMDVRNAVTSDGASAGDLILPQRVPGIVNSPLRRMTIRDLITWGRTTSNSVEFVRELLFTNLAAPVSENPSGTKAESDITFEPDSATVATIAHYIHVSKQVLADVQMLQSYLDGKLRAGLKLKEEDQLLNGSGVGLNIDGIYTQATAYSQPSGAEVDSETQLDRLSLALLQVELSEYSPDAIVLNPVDYNNIQRLKTTDNAYLFTNPVANAQPTLWGRPVVATTAMAAGSFLVGTFGGALAVQGWDREDISLSIATQDGSDFIKNMVKLLVEERLALTVYRPAAFVKGGFTGLPTSA